MNSEEFWRRMTRDGDFKEAIINFMMGNKMGKYEYLRPEFDKPEMVACIAQFYSMCDFSIENKPSHFKRPEWNPAVTVRIQMTLCLKEAIEEATKRLYYLNEEEFIVDTLRKKIEELGIKHLKEPPK